MRSEALREAQRRYVQGLHTYVFRFREDSDSDIIARMEQVGNRTEYIRGLVRRDIRGDE